MARGPAARWWCRADSSGGGTLSEDQYNRVKLQIDEQFTRRGQCRTAAAARRRAGLEGNEPDPKDMDFVEGKNSSARDIALAFGVPPQLLGIPGDNTYSNLQEARLALWEQTVVPLVKVTADALNSWLMPMFETALELVPDTDNISALALRNQAIWDRVETANFLTDDEKRAAVGYGPLPPQAKNIRSRRREIKVGPRRMEKDDGGDSGDGGSGMCGITAAGAGE